jgi:beta-glucosidase
MAKTKALRGVAAILLVLSMIMVWTSAVAFENDGNINLFLGITTSGNQATAFTSAYGELNDENCNQLQADEDTFTTRETEEGSVLLMNENDALPLSASERKVTLFGYGSVNFSYRSSCGGPKLDQARFTSIHDAFTQAGFSVNETVTELYSSDLTEEPENSIFTQTAKASFSEYSDAAIVILTRHGGEGVDLEQVNANGVSDVALQPNEKELLKMVQESGFQKIIVLLNSVYQLEVAELADYGVDSILWIGNPGYQGTPGVVNILTGAANPSGRLVDTYAVDSHSSAAAQNMGEYTYLNGEAQDDTSRYYMVYAENIYVGYRYYETRYEDSVLGRFNADTSKGVFASSGGWNYAEEVSYPFGYGLSYTTFTQSIVPDSFAYDAASDSFTLAVLVENTGSVAGRSVVEVYAQTPYTEENIVDKVEKSAIQLAGFGKTGKLEPGASETVTITFDRYTLASWNETLQRDNGKTGGYVLDAGDYYIALGDNAHDALNNVLAKKGASGMCDFDGTPVSGDASKVETYTLTERDTESYRYSATGAEVVNQFTGSYASDVNAFVPDTVTYMTRSDWNTFPDTVSVTLNDTLKEALVMEQYQKTSATPSLSSVTYGVDAGLTLADMVGLDYDDPQWESFIQQMSLEDLAISPSDQYSNEAVASVRKPKNTNAEGPEGLNGTYKYGNKTAAMCSSAIPILAATWDTEMAALYGFYVGEDALYCGMPTIIMAPAVDLHRTPFGGRAAEYWSECPILTSAMVEPVITNMLEKGFIGTLKHCAVNDQEANRLGVACFLTEQTLRENNLKAFEKTIADGNALGIMTSYNRIGAVYSGNNPVLQDTIFREEWGFKGFTICDATQHSSYSPTADCLSNGADMYCISRRTDQLISDIKGNDDGYLLKKLQETNHRIFYAYANSTLINGLASDTEIKAEFEWWKIALIVLNVAIIVPTIGVTVQYGVKTYGRKKEAVR